MFRTVVFPTLALFIAVIVVIIIYLYLDMFVDIPFSEWSKSTRQFDSAKYDP